MPAWSFSLNVKPVVLEVILMDPVGTAHVGCVTVNVGAAGRAGPGFSTTVVPADIQP